MTAETDDARIRRPRMSPERELELLNAVMEVLPEVGYEALTMDLVAARARCSKATLYRMWSSKLQLVVAALYTTRPLKAEDIDTGSLRGDLLTVAEVMAASAEAATALFGAMGHAVLTDEELATALRTSLVEPLCADLLSIVDRAVERGELASRPLAATFLPQLLLSAAITRPIFEGVLADADYLTRCVDDVLLPALQHS
jgi:AcrR family transcriptional regulator